MIYNKQSAVMATTGSEAVAIPVETHLNGMSSICTVRSADAHSVPSANETRRGRSIRKVTATQKTGDDGGHTDTFSSRERVDFVT